eukprot:6191863-Pleurochrysis_carterae.AAC.1
MVAVKATDSRLLRDSGTRRSGLRHYGSGCGSDGRGNDGKLEANAGADWLAPAWHNACCSVHAE